LVIDSSRRELIMNREIVRLILTKNQKMKICAMTVPEEFRKEIYSDFLKRFWKNNCNLTRPLASSMTCRQKITLQGKIPRSPD